MDLPRGYLKTDHRLNTEEAIRVRQIWNRAMIHPEDGPPVLGSGVTFVELSSPQRVTLKAICLYCGSANLRSALECLGCGAPLTE